jgi:hypothetical protein
VVLLSPSMQILQWYLKINYNFPHNFHFNIHPIFGVTLSIQLRIGLNKHPQLSSYAQNV